MNKYRVLFEIDGVRTSIMMPKGSSITDIMEGFWVDEHKQYTKSSNNKWFVMSHMIRFVHKTSMSHG